MFSLGLIRGMPLRAVLAAAGFAGIAGIAALAVPAQSATGDNTPAPRDAERIYRSTCGYCHGHNVGPIIRGRALPPGAIEAMVRSGNGAMPAFRPTEITNEELAALARWISASKADPKEHGQ
ncbi:cytochrome c [Altererythrobacter fulvus]|uniref:c-type cytochrome n=1 Tax=Caenibius fulvus TaxID=2126012 RepID=UPI00301A3C92